MVPADKELEVKFYLANKGNLQKTLKNLGASLVQTRTHEHNLRFDTVEGTLTSNQQVLRLRKDHANHLTYKGPNDVETGVSARTEIEFSVDNFEKAQNFLEALGYRVSMIYEKYRTVYELSGTLITIDEMPFGDFAEIEGIDRANIENVCNQLGLIWEHRSLESYAVLFEIVKKNLNLSFRDLTFENFAGIKIDASHFALSSADAD
ncbi:MAG: class IV adenylate cyclase [Anaerolineales bacterium]